MKRSKQSKSAKIRALNPTEIAAVSGGLWCSVRTCRTDSEGREICFRETYNTHKSTCT